MKIKSKTTAVKFLIIARILIFGIFFFALTLLKAQGPPFETHFGIFSNGNDGSSTEFVTCGSVDTGNYTYAGVQALMDFTTAPPIYKIRGVRITSGGLMFVSNFDVITEANEDFNIVPLKIIPINGNTEYIITGYVTNKNSINTPQPFIIKADNNLDATDFKIFTDHYGFFSDVDELPSGDFIFSGSTTQSLNIEAASRLGWILRTDSTNFTAQWMRYTYLYEHLSSQYHQDFDIINDVVVLDDDSAIICGTVTEQIDCVTIPLGTLDSTAPRAFIAKINLNDGSFYWHKARFKEKVSPRLAINNSGNLIAMSVNGEQNNDLPALIFFDRSGNFISANQLEPDSSIFGRFRFNGTTYLTANIYIHVPFIQNIYFNNNGVDVFVSGKFINVQVNAPTLLGEFDMPFSGFYTASNSNFSNLNIYKSAQIFQPVNPNFLTYDIWSTSSCNFEIPPFFAASNTLPCLSHCGGYDKYITITLDNASSFGIPPTRGLDKVWIYSNDTNPCGYQSRQTKQDFILYPSSHTDIHNDNIDIVPEIDSIDITNSNPTRHAHSCEQ